MCLPMAKHVYKVEKEWEFAGLKCAVVQGREGSNRCGYVRVPPNHPLHGKDYMADGVDVEVHGGLTYAQIEPCAHNDGTGWWFGFDCAHSGDASYDPDNLPAWYVEMQERNPGIFDRNYDEHFWLQHEVERETEQLAQQLATIAR